MWGSTAWQQKKTPSTLTRNVARQSASANSATEPSRHTPALFTRRSTAPSVSIASATMRRRLPVADVRHDGGPASARRPDLGGDGGGPVRLDVVDRDPHPSRASRSAMARPMPVPAPVTSAVRGAGEIRHGIALRQITRCVAQAPDLGVGVAELAQDLVGLLAGHGRRPADGGPPRRELEREPEEAHPARRRDGRPPPPRPPPGRPGRRRPRRACGPAPPRPRAAPGDRPTPRSSASASRARGCGRSPPGPGSCTGPSLYGASAGRSSACCRTLSGDIDRTSQPSRVS